MSASASPIRSSVLLLLLACGALGCKASAPEAPAAGPDYAKARGEFRTKLKWRGPSPQEGEPIADVPGTRRVEYRSAGHALTAFVSPAPEGTPRPAVLFLHGGFAFGAEDWDMTRPFQDAGFVVMMPLLRGENGQPGTFSFFYDEVEDVLAAAEALASQPGVDPKRVYVTGHSVGGTLAPPTAQASPRYRAASALTGSPDQVSIAEGREDILPFNPEDSREFEMRSPLSFATSLKCPTRLYFGSEEPYFAVPSRQLAIRARKAGLDVAAQQLQGDHFSAVPEGIQRSIAFFREH